MYAKVRRGDVLVSSSDDESEIERIDVVDQELLGNVSATRLSQLVCELSESPPLNDFSRIFQLADILGRLVRKRFRLGLKFLTDSRATIPRLRQLFGFQLITSVVRRNDNRVVAISMMLLNRQTGRGSIRAS